MSVYRRAKTLDDIFNCCRVNVGDITISASTFFDMLNLIKHQEEEIQTLKKSIKDLLCEELCEDLCEEDNKMQEM